MSPPGPALSTLPPALKRHQVGPPGQPDAINRSQTRPSPQSNIAIPAKGPLPPPAPPYSFARDYSSLYPRPYGQSTYSTTPVITSPTMPANGIGHRSQSSTEQSPSGQLGMPASPLSRPATSTVPSNQSSVTPAVKPNPPRQVYDTRPPPTTTSTGFASVNAPPLPLASGFATINPRNTRTPPASHVPLSKPPSEVDENGTPGQQVNTVVENNRFHPYSSAPDSAAGTPAGSSSTKRTPSTTHPYQMSEAFANRHHHCERVDSLNRGVWTSHGIGGTAENPTGPPVEMYLRCNHDGCARIDWRTVHGLQCHIVKNHEQPKGTIGSLEKALERYGVPVKEVEDFEREHGKGTGGTMADPKNLKMKLKTKIQDFSRKGTPGSYGIGSDARPAGYRPSPSGIDDSPTASDGLKTSPDVRPTNGYFNSASNEGRGGQSAPNVSSAAPANAFTAVRPSWMGATNLSTMPMKGESEPKSLQGDFGASSASKNEQTPNHQAGPSDGGNLTTPPSTVTVAPPRLEAPTPMSSMAFAATDQQPSSAIVAPETTSSVSRSESTEVKRPEGKPSSLLTSTQEPAAPPAQDEDVNMIGTEELSQQQKEDKQMPGAEMKSKAEPEKPGQPGPQADDKSETIEVGSITTKDVTVPTTRRSTMQSPTVATRSLTATTPGSARRLKRRASAARKSVDIDSEAGSKVATASEDGDKDEKHSKDDKTEKLEPRRSSRRGTKN